MRTRAHVSLLVFTSLLVALGASPSSAATLSPGDIAYLRLFTGFGDFPSLVGIAQDGSSVQTITQLGENSAGGIAFRDPDTLLVTAAGSFGPEGLAIEALLSVEVASGAISVVSSGGFLSGGPLALGPQGALIRTGGGVEIARIDLGTGAQVLVTSGASSGTILSLTVDPSGSIYALRDTASRSLVRIDPLTGGETTVASGGALQTASDLAIDADGNLMAAISLTDPAPGETLQGGLTRIDVISGQVTLLSSGGFLDIENPSGDRLGTPAYQIAVGPAGEIYVAGWWCVSTGCTSSVIGQLIGVDPSTGDQRFIGTNLGYPIDIASVPVPEPGGVALLALGGVTALARRRAA